MLLAPAARLLACLPLGLPARQKSLARATVGKNQVVTFDAALKVQLQRPQPAVSIRLDRHIGSVFLEAESA